VFAGDQGGKAYAVDSAVGGTPVWQPATGATAIQAGPSVQFRAYSNAAFGTAFPNPGTPTYVTQANASGGAVASLTYALAIPAGLANPADGSGPQSGLLPGAYPGSPFYNAGARDNFALTNPQSPFQVPYGPGTSIQFYMTAKI